MTLALLSVAAGCARPREIDGFHMRVFRSHEAGRTSDLPVVYAEIAATRKARAKGLGDRASLAPDAGMLFVYPEALMREYWMKDCRIGLDIAFLGADGRIVTLASLPPGAGLAESDIPRAKSDEEALYVLETATGWFERNEIHAGDRIDLRRAVVGVSAE
jgi:uncharacterized membrane protein (UPF0127 family)